MSAFLAAYGTVALVGAVVLWALSERAMKSAREYMRVADEYRRDGRASWERAHERRLDTIAQLQEHAP